MIWNDADRMEDNSRRLSEEGEDSAKKAKDTFSVCNDSVGCRCSPARGNPEVTRKSGNEQLRQVFVHGSYWAGHNSVKIVSQLERLGILSVLPVYICRELTENLLLEIRRDAFSYSV